MAIDEFDMTKKVVGNNSEDRHLVGDSAFRNFIEHSTNVFYSHDVNHVLTYLSPQIEDVLGYKPEEAMVVWTELATDHPINAEGFRITQRAIETGEAQPTYELQLRHKSGSPIWVEVREAPLVEDGKTVAIFGTLAEITDRKHAEEELRNSELRYRNIFENAGDAISVVDQNDQILDVNPSMCALMGYSRDELLQMQVSDLQAPEHRGEPGQIILSEYQEYGNSVFEVVNIHKNGNRIPIELRIARLRSEKGDRYYCIYRDISRRKKNENERQELFNTLTTVLESIDAHIYVADLDTFEILFMNKKMQEEFGEDFTGKICYRVFRNEKTVCSHCNNDRLLDEHGEPTGVKIWESQNPITKRWYVNHDRAIRWHDGRMVRIQIATDITERKAIENALRDSEEKYRIVSNLTSDFAYAFEVDENQNLHSLWVTGGLEKISGYTADELREKGGWEALIEPEDMHIPLGQLKQLLSGKPDQVEYRIIRKDGAHRWVMDFARPYWDQSLKRTVLIYGAMQDISERKKAEQLLKDRAVQMATLHAFTLDLTSTDELEPMLESIVAKATDLLSGISGGLYLCDHQMQEVRCVVSYNTQKDFTGNILKFGEGAAGQVAATGKPLIIEDYRKWEGRAKIYQEEESFQAILSAPIIWQEQVKGVLHVMRNSESPQFMETDLDLLMTLANNAAIAIQNARLLQQIQRHANDLQTAVEERTAELQILVDSMVGREVRMAELKKVIKRLRHQLLEAGIDPIADDPLNEPLY